MIKMVKIPRILMEHEYYKNLSDRAKVLYGILSEKKQEAEKHGWVDEQGSIYVVFPKKKMQEELACSRYRLDLVTKELVTTDLISLAYGIGCNMERRIYVHSLNEKRPWIRVRYGDRTVPPDGERNGGGTDKAKKAEDTGNAGEKNGPPDPEKHNAGNQGEKAGLTDVLRMLMEDSGDEAVPGQIGWTVLLDALVSALS